MTLKQTLAVLMAMSCWVSARAQAADCPAAPAGIRDIRANTFYVDDQHSVADPILHDTYDKAIRPLEDYLRSVAAMADRYLDKHDESAGRCAVKWLDRWARDDALLGRMINARGDTQADFERKWLLAGLSIAYIKVKVLADADEQARIGGWMMQIADKALALFDSPKHKRNNHYYWVGLAVLGTGIAADSSRHVDAARQIFDKALSDIQDDGTLPMEMDRGGMALHYHNYALAPLVVMAELARMRDEDWYARNDGRLNLLANRVVAGIADPSWFQQRTGKTQKIPSGAILGWTEFFRLHASQPAPFETLAAKRPLRYQHFGGDLTALLKSGLLHEAPVN